VVILRRDGAGIGLVLESQNSNKIDNQVLATRTLGFVVRLGE
jgi:hypothetical protein